MRAVLTAIASQPGATSADAARTTGLSPATVSRLVQELTIRNLILEGERVRGKRGQPGVALFLNPDGAYSAGCQIGFGTCYLFIRSLGGKILAEREFDISQCAYGHVADAVARGFEHCRVAARKNSADLVGLGVAVPVDFDKLCLMVMGEHQAPWDERAFRVELEQRIEVPVSTYSTGSAGAWGELAATPPPRPADYLYLFVDRFIQSGFLLDGRLWTAPQGRYGSLGRTRVGPKSKQQRLYDVVGGHAWMQAVARGGGSRAEVTAHWLERAGEALATAVQTSTDGLDLPLVVLDGSISGDLLDALAAELSSQLADFAWSSPPVIRRGLAGALAPAKGAALRPLYSTFFSDELA